MTETRVALLREQMRTLGVDTFLITQPENRRYISGFSGSAGVVLVTFDATQLATDFRYYEQAEQQAPGFELVKVEGRMEHELPRILRGLGSHRVAFEAESLTYDLYETYASVLPDGMELVPTKNVLRDLRAVKDASEIEVLRRAVEVTDQALASVRMVLAPGMSEREVAWRLEKEMREAGAEAVSFDLIVAAGPAGAMAHARPTDRPIGVGEPIVIDMGCKWEGYCSDLTRTLVIGEPDGKFREIYDIVLRAQERAEREITSGMAASDADAIARQVIDDAGYGEAFGHTLGHGVGLAIHELPTVGPLSDQILRPGMVFSVEPGIYLSGWGGVRIEDLAYIGDGGLVVLSRSSKDPLVPLRLA